MRRTRSIREHRNKLLRNRAVSSTKRRKQTNDKILEAKSKNKIKQPTVVDKRPKPPEDDRWAYKKAARRRLKNRPDASDPPKYPSSSEFDFAGFLTFSDYEYKSRTVNVLHIIESVGLGGAQTMMLELVNGLNSYYGDHINNVVVHIAKRAAEKKNPTQLLFKSYGVIPQPVAQSNLKKLCVENSIDVVVHHRIANSVCMKCFLPENVKYILLNHTWNLLAKISGFRQCDLYLSVCSFLDNKTKWPSFIHDSRKIVILNGVENKYLEDIRPADLDGKFKTGRCHRMVAGKFAVDSLHWMHNKVSSVIPGFKHYLMGTSAAAKATASSKKSIHYFGSVLKRKKKMSIIKALDVYFYETFQNEGASVAILESLACGVPVICKPLGGNSELVRNGLNGYLVADRSDFLLRMKSLADNRALLDKLKEQTAKDFEDRLHVKHTACKYMQLFERLIYEPS